MAHNSTTNTVDFITKKRVKYNGLVPRYYVENNHEAFIPFEIFMQVQVESIRRRVVHTKNCSFAQMIISGN
ncbi:hypothetical protein HQN90_36310 [Paenibacillus alba]|uniref:hypothetical protein n=1 Tax=Paenibacillus alba TaxID=1197127 RepID=UPI001C20536E|nr:hypothetical protein [Paenibacillus alba]NQX71556.1 hypothetical protein [Paenibacillus alba]